MNYREKGKKVSLLRLDIAEKLSLFIYCFNITYVLVEKDAEFL